MRTAIYAAAKIAILGVTLDLLASGIKVMALDATYTPDFGTDEFLSDIPGGSRVTAGVALTSKTLVRVESAVKYDADDVTFLSVTGDPIKGLVMYLDTGSEGTSKLIGYFDYFGGLPITPTGANILFRWPPYAIFVLDDGVLGGPQGVPGEDGADGVDGADGTDGADGVLAPGGITGQFQFNDTGDVLGGSPNLINHIPTGEVHHLGNPTHKESRADFEDAVNFSAYGKAYSVWNSRFSSDATPFALQTIEFPAADFGDCIVTLLTEVTISSTSGGGNLAWKSVWRRNAGILEMLAEVDNSDPSLLTIAAGLGTNNSDNDSVNIDGTGPAFDAIWIISTHVQIAKEPT